MTDNQEVYRDVLPEGFELHWYEVQSVLGRGAFGVTYLALDKNLDQLVAIKEYFPNDFSARESGYTVHPTTGKSKEMYEWGLDRFIREARILARFKHANIVRVLSVFEHNNTAYMVMEYEQGEELSKLFKRKESFTEQEMLDVFLPILDGLKLVHDAGFIHRDIKPSNIYIREDGSPVLIDFGAARQVTGAPTRALTSLVTFGYAPFEQYNESEEKQGPWTDIYALGASLFSGLMGKLPIDALARGSSMLSTGIDPYEPLSVILEGKYSAAFLRAIDHALLFHANDRPQDVMVWADMLAGKVEVPELPPAMRIKPPQEEDPNATVVLSKQPSVQYEEMPEPQKETGAEKPPAEPRSQAMPQPAKPQLARPRPNLRLISSMLMVVVIIITGTVLLMQGPEETQVPAPPPSSIADQAVDQLVDQTSLLLTQAERARQAGNYIEPEGNNALQLYLQVLALEPSNQQANNAIEEIIDLYSGGIQSDLAEGYLDKADKNLQRLLAARPASEKLLKLREQLKAVRSVQSSLALLLSQADDYLQQNSLLSPRGKNALSTLRKVLELDPDNKAAMKRIATLASHYVELAEEAIAAGNLSAANENISNVKLIDADHPALAQLRSKLAALKIKRRRQLNAFISQAREALDADRLLSPTGKNALYFYQQALKIEPRNTKAKSGIEKIKARLKASFDGHLKMQNHSAAGALVKAIEKAMPRSSFARNLRAEWEKNSPSEKPGIQVVEEMIGVFKQALESRNQHALAQMSEFMPNRQAFVDQLFENYRSFKLQISNVRFIGKENKGVVDIKITDLVNIQGLPVQPGGWSQFAIEIKKNKAGQWKVFW